MSTRPRRWRAFNTAVTSAEGMPLSEAPHQHNDPSNGSQKIRMILHPQLEADCHLLGTLPSGTVLLHRNAMIPWIILVPDTGVLDLLELPSEQLQSVMGDAQRLSTFVTGYFQCPKINFAAIGNVVPQMHLHIVGRRPGDSCWPGPVWGNLIEQAAYTDEELAGIALHLKDSINLKT
ncbi:MAG: HIT domain-containing protein [Planctomycetaceae bacterium]|nr:HIT domain-containing protein [Planctomycetaceae bacterium]